MTLLKILLVILLIYYGIKLVFRFFGPLILGYFGKKISQKIQQKFEGSGLFTEADSHDITNESTNRKSASNKRKIKDDTIGDYIDFEEIE